MSNDITRDHLFISYATEDSKFAEWLAIRLTAEGYKVWCDRTHLMGGESYPDDIDHAIKDRTFRLLALLSRASLQKANPRKERTLALNIARDRQTNFLIPLNVDGLSAMELDWMTSDLTFIQFHNSWAYGFEQLLKKLKSIDTPQNVDAGRANIQDWMAVHAKPTNKKEILRSNVLPVTELPTVLQKFELQEKLILPKLAEHWPFFSPTNSKVIWAFGPPEVDLNVPVRSTAAIPWQEVPEFDGLKMEDLALSILRKAITVKCLQGGMKLVPKSSLPYFPEGLLPENHLRFTSYGGKKTYVSAIGERTFRVGEYREQIKYHLAPIFRLTADPGQLMVRVSISLHLTDLSGYPLEGAKVISRRKRICRNWWNHEWLSRFMAVVEWLCQGQAGCNVLRTTNGSFCIKSEPLILSAQQGIDESILSPVVIADTDVEVIDEDVDDGKSDFDDYDDNEQERDDG